MAEENTNDPKRTEGTINAEIQKDLIKNEI